MVRNHKLIFFFLIIFMLSCSGKKDTRPEEITDPEKAFIQANELIEKKDFEKARAMLQEIKNRDLTRKIAPLAHLKIADSYIKEDEPELGITEYKRFLEMYPDHQYAPYAQYQIAMVYFNRIEDAERGRGDAVKAVEEFEKLKRLFPRNPYKDIIDSRIKKCRNIMAEYEYIVGKFYYKKGSYNAAIGRFEGLFKNYPDYKEEDAALFFTGMSYKRLGQKDKASEYLTRLIEKYPHHKLSDEARKELADLGSEK
ncbi:MAG: outer membrane protein assembly factor BamD [Nitrospirota bacterium]